MYTVVLVHLLYVYMYVQSKHFNIIVVFFFQDAMVELGEEDDVKDDDDGDEYVIETELVEDEVILAMQMWLLLCSLAF